MIMELRRMGDAILRFQTSHFAFLIPALSSRRQSIFYRTVDLPQRRQLQQALIAANSHKARRCIATSAAATSITLTEKPLESSKSTDWYGAGTRLNRNGIYPNKGYYSSSLEDQALLNQGSSADDVLKALNKMNPLGRGTVGSDPAGLIGSSVSHSTKTGYQVMQDVNKTLNEAMATRERLSLTPRTGRTIHVQGNIDVGKGFRLLGQSCAKNKIKQDYMYQRFHERPGLKRKRLRSQRWRKRFMLAFQATVTRVKQLSAQGW